MKTLLSKAKVEKAVERIIEEMLKENCTAELVQLEAVRERADGYDDVTSIEDTFIGIKLSNEECLEVKKCVIDRINAELSSNKHSKLVTGRMVSALIDLEILEEFKLPKGSRVQHCYKVICDAMQYGEDSVYADSRKKAFEELAA